METPSPRYRRDIDTEETPTVPEKCPGCLHDDPQHRSHHYLSLAKFEGQEQLRWHLTKQFVTLRDAGKKRADMVDDIMTWVNDLITLYGDLAHPETGAPLTWSEARSYCVQQRDAMAQRAFERAPLGYTWKAREAGELEPWLQDVMLKYAPVMRREPGEDRLEDI